MGISASKRVRGSLRKAADLDSACNSVFDELSALNYHHNNQDDDAEDDGGVLFPYQLFDASNRLHTSLSASNRLVKKWVPTPPPRDLVDRAYRSITTTTTTRSRPAENLINLGRGEFKAFAVELFAAAVVGNAARAVATRVPIGAAGIAGVGIAAKFARRDLIGAAIGLYALGVATSVYVTLS